MKTKKLVFAGTLLLAFFTACKDEIEPGIEFDPVQFASLDEDGGTWNPILLTAGSDIAVNAPSDPASAEYVAELAEVKSMSASISGEAKEMVDYWSTNGVIRWNEILRELTAKYFILPAPNSDGSYSWPDPANPAAYPQVPFSSPPFACRAYAYLSAGTFDALISAWHYKYEYMRNAPSVYDGSITTNLPLSDLPAYPSEDAVVAGFSRTLLTFLFPLEAEYIAQKAKEHEESRLYAGMNVRSDLIAGDTLGKKVAASFIARAKADLMKFTLGTEAQYDSLYAYWGATGNVIWESLEIPPRQPLAINFGQVTPWTITTAEVTTTYRLAGPPPVGSAEFDAALAEVKDYSENATNEEKQIAFKWDDGPSTYTPPGHWNAIAGPYIHSASMNPLRSARVLAYLNMAMQDAGIAVWDNKYQYYFPRPTNADEEIKTLLGVPNFPAYPSGHSGFSSAAAAVLGYFFASEAGNFNSMANEAALSRLYGCIHYRFDCDDGISLGSSVAQNAINMATVDGAD